MNLVIITGHYPFGNGEEFLEMEIEALEKQFAHIDILSLSRDTVVTKYVPENCTYISLRSSRIEFVCYMKSLFQLFTKNTINEIKFSFKCLKYRSMLSILKEIFIYYYFANIISSHIISKEKANETIYYSYWLNSAAYALAVLKRKGYIFHAISRAHGGDAFIERGYLPFRQELLTGLDAVFSISQAGKISIESEIIPFIKGPHTQIKVSRLGVKSNDISSINPHRDSQNDFYHIVTCSNIIPIKRIDMLIEALSLIKNIKLIWTHFGDGPQYEHINAKATHYLRDSKNIKYIFKGRKPKSEILQFYSKNHVDLFVNCSDYEGIPVSIMEAFSFGIPAIARDTGGNMEIIEDKVNGLALPTNCSPNELAAKIEEFCNLPESYIEQMRINAIRTIEDKYTAKTNFDTFIGEVLNALCK